MMAWEVTEVEVQQLIALNSDILTPERLEHYKMLAPIYYEVACDYCNATLDVTNSGVQVFVAKAIQYYANKAGLVSRSMGTVSYSYTTSLPASVLQLLNPFRKLRW